MDSDHYETLGVGRDADDDQLREAWRREAKEHHPDSSVAPDPGRFRDVQEAYETLRDPTSRRRYDQDLEDRGESAEPGPGRVRRAGPAWGGAADRGAWALRRPRPQNRTPYAQDLELEVALTPREAALGIRVPLTLPVRSSCPWCAALGIRSMFCPVCGGTGVRESMMDAVLDLPPGVEHGSRFLVRTGGHGGSVFVRVTVTVEE